MSEITHRMSRLITRANKILTARREWREAAAITLDIDFRGRRAQRRRLKRIQRRIRKIWPRF